LKPVIAFAPPLDHTPTLPVMTLVGTLVTVEAPKTVKLASFEPSNGAAHDGDVAQNTPIVANASIDNDFSELALRGLLARLEVMFMLVSL